MGIGLGSIVSIGGGTGGSGGSGSGITSINNQFGPAVTITGVNGIGVTAAGNVITVNAAALSGLIPSSGLTEINSQTGPAIQISGINGIVVTQPRTNFILIDAASISGVGSSSGEACYTTTFTGVIEQTFTHSLGTKAIIVQIQDTNDEFISADLITAIDINNVTVRFNTIQSGRITVVSCGGSMSAPSGVTKFAASFLGITSGMFIHGLNTRDVLVQIYDVSGPPRQILADDIILDSLDAVSLLFNTAQSGRIVIMG